MNSFWTVIAVASVLAAVAWFMRDRLRRRAVPEALRPGHGLPELHAVDENGSRVSSRDLLGAAAVILFVRGTWCPFCSRQVANLTRYYKEITDAGARLILVTPRPLETTRRVADMFGVEFEFWLDESLEAATRLGLVIESGVPEEHRREFGTDTLWPATLVVDASGIIRHTEISRFIADRPNPERLLSVVRSVQQPG